LAFNHKPFKIRIPECSHCGSFGKHYSWQCPQKPQAVLRTESPKAKAKRVETSNLWYELNPPDNRGNWRCYLRISPDCPKYVNRATINLEHVLPRVKYRELKYDVANIRPACRSCNKLKGPWTLEQLAETYPRAEQVIKEIAQEQKLASIK
jgi:5-methylcytosine-specific restriction endonuclease McrA